MNFSSFFGLGKKTEPLPITPGTSDASLAIVPDYSPNAPSLPAVIEPNREQLGIVGSEIAIPDRAWFLPTQLQWIESTSRLRIWEKSRQVGATKTDAFDSVLKASPSGARFDVWVTSRDELQARLYLDDCKEWARILNLAATDIGKVILDRKNNSSAYVLQFANGRSIYCLSSNPNALAGKRGHVKIDEFALHPDQAELYKIAKPITQWGGTLSIISTHRGPGTVFNQIIRDIKYSGNPMGWFLLSYPIQKAVEEGIVERINEKTGDHDTPGEFLARIQKECINEDQWKREYCCIPSDENSAFITHDMITACEDPEIHLMSIDELIHALNQSSSGRPPGPSSSSILSCDSELFLGLDFARSQHLCVFDLGQRIGNIIHSRLRLEFRNQPFPETRAQLYRLLALPELKRACIDHNGNGMQLAEEAQLEFGSKVEPVHITTPVKEKLAFGLLHDFESLTLRIPIDSKLRADLYGIKKQVSIAGNIQFIGDTDDSHCDRFWAMALRQEASRSQAEEPWALLC